MKELIRNINYDLSYDHSISQQSLQDDLIEFRKGLADCFSNQLTLPVSASFIEMIRAVSRVCGEQVNSVSYDSRTAAIMTSNLFITIEDDNGSNIDLWTKYDRSIVVTCHGNVDALAAVCKLLKDTIEQRKIPTVTWEFLAGDERRSQDVKIEKAKPIYKEFYPWIGDVYHYFDQYLASEASILVLLGETGTAKTSFIRSMIWHASLNTMFTYEEELLKSDSLFVDFIVDEDINLLVIEDADLFLSSREHDGNKIMSKFLNVSDGLANIGQKKIVFTANITEPSKIDNALLRAGRCFDCLLFRRLTYVEAVAAATAAGIAVPVKEQSYTLAEIFALSKGERRSFSTRGVGFIK